MYCTTSTLLLHVQVYVEFMYSLLLHELFYLITSLTSTDRHRLHVPTFDSCTVLPQHFSYMYRYIDSSCTQHYCMYCTTSKLLLHVQVYIEFIYSPEVRIIYYLNTSPTLSSFTVPPQHFSYMYRYN